MNAQGRTSSYCAAVAVPVASVKRDEKWPRPLTVDAWHEIRGLPDLSGSEGADMATVEVKSLDSPDETRPFADKGQAEVINIGGGTVLRGTFELGGAGLTT